MAAGKKRLGLTPMVPQMASQPPVAILDIGPLPRPQIPNPKHLGPRQLFILWNLLLLLLLNFYLFSFLHHILLHFLLTFFLQFDTSVERAPSKPFPIFNSLPSLLPVEVSLISYYLSQKPNFMHFQKIYSSSVSTFQFHVFSIYTPPTHPNYLFGEFDKHF